MHNASNLGFLHTLAFEYEHVVINGWEYKFKVKTLSLIRSAIYILHTACFVVWMGDFRVTFIVMITGWHDSDTLKLFGDQQLLAGWAPDYIPGWPSGKPNPHHMKRI